VTLHLQKIYAETPVFDLCDLPRACYAPASLQEEVVGAQEFDWVAEVSEEIEDAFR
jgi:hypothetical protein